MLGDEDPALHETRTPDLPKEHEEPFRYPPQSHPVHNQRRRNLVADRCLDW